MEVTEQGCKRPVKYQVVVIKEEEEPVDKQDVDHIIEDTSWMSIECIRKQSEGRRCDRYAGRDLCVNCRIVRQHHVNRSRAKRKKREQGEIDNLWQLKQEYDFLKKLLLTADASFKMPKYQPPSLPDSEFPVEVASKIGFQSIYQQTPPPGQEQDVTLPGNLKVSLKALFHSIQDDETNVLFLLHRYQWTRRRDELEDQRQQPLKRESFASGFRMKSLNKSVKK